MKYIENILTFNDWHDSIVKEDGRKWRLEEGPNNTTLYVELVEVPSLYDSDREGPAVIARRKIRELLKTKVRKEEKTYITRISYTRAVRQYHPGGDVPLYSGSSLQRKKKKYPAWIQRMKKFLLPKLRGRLRHRELVGWSTVGGHISRTRQRERYEPGLQIKARQKIYAALSERNFDFLPDVENGVTLHYFNGRSKNKFQESARTFWRSYPGRKTMVTLTFIQHISDAEGVKILNKFLTVARREFPGLQYLWVAEHQPENENHTIHFHVIFSQWLKVKRFNPLWVMQQYNAGLRGHRKVDGSEITLADITAAYNERKVGKLLNPYHIDDAKNVSQLAAYLTKYVTKTDPHEAFGCSNWHCSRKISRLFKKKVEGLSTFRYLHSFKNNIVHYKTKEIAPPMTYTGAFFSMVRIHNAALVLPIFSEMEEINTLLLTTNWSPGRLVGDMQISEEEYRKLFVVPESQDGENSWLTTIDSGAGIA